jgi:hypothetical protein
MTKLSRDSRTGERGAVSIKTILTFGILAVVVFAVVTIAPVYVEEREVIYDVEELARISAVRNYNADKIKEGIQRIRADHDLPEDSISLEAFGDNVRIKVNYNRDLYFLITTYEWRVEKTVLGRSL